MKKYWINELTEKQVIHAPTEEVAKKLCNRFHELGLKWRNKKSYSRDLEWNTFKEETCYLPSNGEFCGLSYYTKEGYEIIIVDQLMDFQEYEYPKLMQVSNDLIDWNKRVVFMEKNGKYLAWAGAKTIKKAEEVSNVVVWRYAREIQPGPTLELTIDEIAEKFNVSPEQIKIKK